MLNLKKVIASICVIAMVLTTVAFGATFTDVAEDSAYYEAVETLSKLGIVNGYEDGSYKPENGVTRAEMAKLIACIQGFGETANGNTATAFTDVPATHWASGYIANASGMGIINGYGDGTFGPEDPVLYEQAVKMIMAALGYTPYAEKNGGYPTGYLAAAQSADVTVGVSNAAVGKEANRGTIAQLLANAIDTPLMVQSKWNTNGEVEYEIADKSDNYQTLMSENLGYVKLKGIVEETSLTTLGDSKTFDITDDKEVEINVTGSYGTNNKTYLNHINCTAKADDKNYGKGYGTFLVGTTDAEDYLGYAVVAYVKNVEDEFEIVSIAKASNNEELTISLDQISDFDEDAAKLLYKKDGSKTETKVLLDTEYTAILNGTGVADVTDYFVQSYDAGEITFINNNDDKLYDVVVITKPETLVVEDVTSNSITFDNGNKIKFDEDDTNKFFELTKDGEVIDFTTLVEWDVLSVYAAGKLKDAAIVKAEVIGTEVVGTITSTKTSNKSATETAYKINDVWYEAANDNYEDDLLRGEGGTFYIDQFGKIAAFKEDAALAAGTTANYAYVIKAGLVDDALEDNTLKAKLLTTEGIVTYSFKTKFDLKDGNGDKITTYDLKSKADDAETAIKALEGSVVMFTKSGDSINAIITASDNGDRFATGNIEAEGTFAWDAAKNRLNTYKIDPNAVIFMIDEDDVEDSKIGTVADFEDEAKYTIFATFKTRDNNLNDVVVADAGSFNFSPTTNVAIITEVGYSSNDAEEEIYEISYILNGEEFEGVETVAVEDLDVDDLTVGDVAKIKVGSDNVVTHIDVVFNFGEDIRSYTLADAADVDVDFDVDDVMSDEEIAGGVVTLYDKDTKEATIDGKAYDLAETRNVYVIDASESELSIEEGSYSDFNNIKELYENEYVNVEYKGTTKTKMAAADAQALVDQVFVRLYDDEVTAVIIVKGLDIDVEAWVAE